MNPKKTVLQLVESTVVGKRLTEDPRYRLVFFAALRFFFNLLYALYNGFLGLFQHSLWFTTMCAYYIILSMMDFSAVLCEGKAKGSGSVVSEYFVMRLTGALLALMSFVLTGVVYISLSQNVAVKYHEILMITIAAYTFTKITMAVRRGVKHRHDPSPLTAVIRGIGYADVAVSVLTLQRSMLVSFDGMDDAGIHLMNALTGAAVCLFVLALGILMICRGKRGKNPGKIPIPAPREEKRRKKRRQRSQNGPTKNRTEKKGKRQWQNQK
ncbi:MAG: hypothetical protein ACI3W6_01600 [Clostridia bacterium]